MLWAHTHTLQARPQPGATPTEMYSRRSASSFASPKEPKPADRAAKRPSTSGSWLSQLPACRAPMMMHRSRFFTLRFCRCSATSTCADGGVAGSCAQAHTSGFKWIHARRRCAKAATDQPSCTQLLVHSTASPGSAGRTSSPSDATTRLPCSTRLDMDCSTSGSCRLRAASSSASTVARSTNSGLARKAEGVPCKKGGREHATTFAGPHSLPRPQLRPRQPLGRQYRSWCRRQYRS